MGDQELEQAYARGYAAGMADSDGSIHHASGHSKRAGARVSITFSQPDRSVLALLQELLVKIGIASDLRGPYKQPGRNDMHRLVLTEQADVLRFIREVGFRQVKRAARAENYLRGRSLTAGEGK